MSNTTTTKKLVITIEGDLTLGELTEQMLMIDHDQWSSDCYVRVTQHWHDIPQSTVIEVFP